MLKALDINDFDKMYSIMENSFPSDEYRPCDEQKALFENREYKVYTWHNDNDDVIAFISTWEFENFLYIEHFAVSPKYRSGGTGTKILNAVKNETNKVICLEVEPPNEDISKRRIGFYERNGFFLNEYPYTQPPISKGKNPIPLMIMTYDRKISKKEFNDIKNRLYTSVYKMPVCCDTI